MRKLYLLLNMIFIAAIVLLLDAYASSVKPTTTAPEKQKQNTKKQVRKITNKPHKQLVIPDENLIEILNNSNLFEANRGEEEKAPPDKKPEPRNNSSFKLTGVCHFGKLKGAIITSANRSKTSSGKNYFSIGEEVGDGYKLYEVEEKTVVLKNGNRKLTLELEKVKTQAQPPGITRNNRGTVPRRPSPTTTAARVSRLRNNRIRR